MSIFGIYEDIKLAFKAGSSLAIAIVVNTVDENQHLTPGKGKKYLPNQSVLFPAV